MVQVQMHEERPIGIKLPETVMLEVVEADAVDQGPDRRLVLQAGQAGERPAHAGAAVHHRRREDHRLHRRRRLRAAGGVDADHSALLNVMIAAARKARARSSATSARSRTCRSRSRGRPISSPPPTARAEEIAARRADQGAARLRLPRRGRRPARGHRQDPHLDRRSARRHHQLPARHSAVRDLDRAGARGHDRRRRRSTIRSPTSCSPPSAARAPSSTTSGCASRRASGWPTR